MNNRFALFCSMIAVFSTPAFGQDMGAAFINAGIGNSGIEAVNQSIANEVENDRVLTRQNNLSSLNYNVSQSVRRTNMNRFLSEFHKVDPEGASKATKIVDDGKVIDNIDQSIRSIGLKATNVADAYAFWWIVAWHAANKQKGSPDPRIISAVKRQTSNALLSTPSFINASDEVKQEIAESMLLQATFIDGHIDLAAGNPAQQAALAKAVNQGAKKMGLNLTTMDLTEQGFVPRSGGRSDAGDVNVPGEEGNALAANDNAAVGESDTGKLALYGVGGAALLAGMFALGKSFGGKG